MPYTVNTLAKLSGVSVRTLHHYDDIGLLKPAYYGDNNYRYYEEDQLLLLQQILFYKQLGFTLADTQKIINDADFDKTSALQSHKEILEHTLDRTQYLIKTIDKTIAHLRRTETMKLEEIFDGFTTEKQKMYEDFLIESGISQVELDSAKDKVKNWGKDKWLDNKREADKIYNELSIAIDHNQEPSSTKVQALIKQHYEMTKQFWTPARESYIGLGQLYSSHPDFVRFYNDINPKLLSFLIAAMKIFADKELS